MQYGLVIAQYLFPLITFPYLTRVLTPKGYGVVTYIAAFTSYLTIIIDFGFILSGTKEIVEHKEDKNSVGHILGSIIYAKIILFIICSLIFSISILIVPLVRQNMLFSIISLMSVFISIFLPDFLFRGIERMEIITYRYVISKAITTALTFILVKSAKDILYVPLLNVVGGIVSVLMTWYSIHKNLHIQIKHIEFHDAMVELRKSLVYFVSNFTTTFYGIANTFILGLFLPVEEIAYWGTAYSLIASAQALYSPILNSLYPHMLSNKDFRLVRKIFLILMPAIIITDFIVYIYAGNIIFLFGGKAYESAIKVFRILLPVLIISFPAMLFGWPVLGVLGKEKETTKTTIFSSLFHMFGLVMLIMLNSVSLVTVAILRVITEVVLLLSRLLIFGLSISKKNAS